MEQNIDDTVKDLMSAKLKSEQENMLRENLKSEEYRHKFRMAYILWRQVAVHYGNNFQSSKAWNKVPHQKFRQVSLSNNRWIWAAAVFALLAIAGMAVYYGTHQPDSQVSPQMVLIDVSRGSKTHVILPDQTSVWLNAGSQLQYADDFSKQRYVLLTGEAMFDVTSDTTKPFIIQTDELTVEVLGTVFDVKAYGEEQKASVAVVEGLVKVSSNHGTSITVSPSQQAVLDKKTGIMQSEIIDIEKVTAWRVGKWFFRNQKISEICLQMERAYDIDIIIRRPGLSDKSFYADFVHGETPEQILRIMDVEKEWKLTLSDKTITID